MPTAATRRPTLEQIAEKVHPSRLQCSPKFTAYLAYLCGVPAAEQATTPVVTSMAATVGGFLSVHVSNGPDYLDSVADLERNVAGLSREGIVTPAERDLLFERIDGLFVSGRLTPRRSY
jgi:hypothetical protein